MRNTWRHKILAVLAVPLLAAPSAIGVYTYLMPQSGQWAAISAAIGFEVVYLGTNILVITSPDLRRYARNVSLAAVVVAVLMNSLAHYGAKVAGAYAGAPFDLLAAMLALIASAPLAGLAYAVSVLLHRLSEADVQHTAAVVRMGVEIAQRDEALAQLRGELAQWQQRAAQDAQAAASWRASAERAADETAQLHAEIARLQEALAHTPQDSALDMLRIAQALREPRAASWREIEELLGIAQSTLRSRLNGQERRNGKGAAQEI